MFQTTLLKETDPLPLVGRRMSKAVTGEVMLLGHSIEMEDRNPDPITYSWSSVNVFARRKAPNQQEEQEVKQIAGVKIPFWRSRGKTQEPDDPKLSTSGTTKHILKNVSGICRPGELLAIMGASGAGKTSLLNVLTQRNNEQLKVTGDLFVNGVRIQPDDLTSCMAYVQQDDLFAHELTVREQLIFQAMLRMPRHTSKEERMARVERVIMELGLVKCEDNQIGTLGMGSCISGGEMKRLSFACEVLTNPALMFCDEPTSGLDSYMAQNVVAVMKNMAQRGKTIISTIHQPSSEVYAMFDRVLFMAEGRVAFLGPANDALCFFAKLGYPCPQQHNPADHFIQELSIDPAKGRIGAIRDRERVNLLCNAFSNSDPNRDMQKDIRDNQTSRRLNGQAMFHRSYQEVKEVGRYRSGWCTQLRWLIWRMWRITVREPYLLRGRTWQILMMSFAHGFLYLGQNNDEMGVFNINGLLYCFMMSSTYQNIVTVMRTFMFNMEVVYREHENGMYSPSAHFLAHTITQAPIFTVLSLFHCLFVYFVAGLSLQGSKIVVCAVLLNLITWSSVSFGYVLSCAAPNFQAGTFMMATTTMPMMLISGFFMNIRSIPQFLSYLRYLSWFSFGYKALVVNQWLGITNITCTYRHQDPVGDAGSLEYQEPGAEEGAEEETKLPCYPNGDAVIEKMGFAADTSVIVEGIVGLVALVIFYRVIAFWIFYLKTRRRKIKVA